MIVGVVFIHPRFSLTMISQYYEETPTNLERYILHDPYRPVHLGVFLALLLRYYTALNLPYSSMYDLLAALVNCFHGAVHDLIHLLLMLPLARSTETVPLSFYIRHHGHQLGYEVKLFVPLEF